MSGGTFSRQFSSGMGGFGGGTSVSTSTTTTIKYI